MIPFSLVRVINVSKNPIRSIIYSEDEGDLLRLKLSKNLVDSQHFYFGLCRI
jgi:hypothetical protein